MTDESTGAVFDTPVTDENGVFSDDLVRWVDSENAENRLWSEIGSLAARSGVTGGATYAAVCRAAEEAGADTMLSANHRAAVYQGACALLMAAALIGLTLCVLSRETGGDAPSAEAKRKDGHWHGHRLAHSAA